MAFFNLLTIGLGDGLLKLQLEALTWIITDQLWILLEPQCVPQSILKPQQNGPP